MLPYVLLMRLLWICLPTSQKQFLVEHFPQHVGVKTSPIFYFSFPRSFVISSTTFFCKIQIEFFGCSSIIPLVTKETEISSQLYMALLLLRILHDIQSATINAIDPEWTQYIPFIARSISHCPIYKPETELQLPSTWIRGEMKRERGKESQLTSRH